MTDYATKTQCRHWDTWFLSLSWIQRFYHQNFSGWKFRIQIANSSFPLCYCEYIEKSIQGSFHIRLHLKDRRRWKTLKIGGRGIETTKSEISSKRKKWIRIAFQDKSIRKLNKKGEERTSEIHQIPGQKIIQQPTLTFNFLLQIFANREVSIAYLVLLLLRLRRDRHLRENTQTSHSGRERETNPSKWFEICRERRKRRYVFGFYWCNIATVIFQQWYCTCGVAATIDFQIFSLNKNHFSN